MSFNKTKKITIINYAYSGGGSERVLCNFANLFSPLFIFISVVFFTSKMASHSEIIAIFNSGMSFKRFLRPFIISSFLLAIVSFVLGNYIMLSYL